MLKAVWSAVLTMGLTIQNAAASPFEYSNLLDGRPTISIQIDPPMIISGDRAINAEFCDGNGGFSCFNSEWISFSFPRERGGIPSEWNQNGAVFKITGHTVVRAFGVCRDAYKVVSNQNGREFEFLYSFSYGLLGFNVEIDGQRVTYIAQRQLGFGATKTVGTPASRSLKQQRENSKKGGRIESKCYPS